MVRNIKKGLTDAILAVRLAKFAIDEYESKGTQNHAAKAKHTDEVCVKLESATTLLLDAAFKMKGESESPK